MSDVILKATDGRFTKSWSERHASTEEMYEDVQLLKELMMRIMFDFDYMSSYKLDDVKQLVSMFFTVNQIQLLDILDDTLYAQLNH